MSTNIFDAWKEYENIAMHFNELLIKLRSQALAGITALSAFAGFIAKQTGGTAAFNWVFFGSILAFLLLCWIAIWLLDALYYNRLLLGTVEELIRIEKLSEQQTVLDRIALSQKIAEVERTGEVVHIRSRKCWECLCQGRVLFYVLPFIGLLSGSIASFCTVLH